MRPRNWREGEGVGKVADGGEEERTSGKCGILK